MINNETFRAIGIIGKPLKLLANIWFICFTQWNCKEVATFWTISSNYGGDDSIYGIWGCRQISCGDKWIAGLPRCPRLSIKSRQIVCLVVWRTPMCLYSFLSTNVFVFLTFPLPASKVDLCTVIMTKASLTNDDIGLLVPVLAFIIIS